MNTPSFITSEPMHTQTDKLAYTIDEAVAACGVGRTKLYALIKAGEIKAMKLGKNTIIRREQLVAFLDRQEVAGI